MYFTVFKMSAFSRTIANFVQPAVNGFVTVLVDSSTSYLANGQMVYVENGGGHYSVYNISSDSSVILRNLGYAENVGPGGIIPTGSKLVASGVRGAAGTDISINRMFTSAGNPNGVITAAGPAICLGLDESLWAKTSGANTNTGWIRLI